VTVIVGLWGDLACGGEAHFLTYASYALQFTLQYSWPVLVPSSMSTVPAVQHAFM